MYISKAKKYRDQGDGTAIAYDYYRLTKSYIDKDGKTKHRSVLCLGELPGFDKDERNRLAAMLTTMIEDGQSVMCDNKKALRGSHVSIREVPQQQVCPGKRSPSHRRAQGSRRRGAQESSCR